MLGLANDDRGGGGSAVKHSLTELLSEVQIVASAGGPSETDSKKLMRMINAAAAEIRQQKVNSKWLSWIKKLVATVNANTPVSQLRDALHKLTTIQAGNLNNDIKFTDVPHVEESSSEATHDWIGSGGDSVVYHHESERGGGDGDGDGDGVGVEYEGGVEHHESEGGGGDGDGVDFAKGDHMAEDIDDDEGVGAGSGNEELTGLPLLYTQLYDSLTGRRIPAPFNPKMVWNEVKKLLLQHRALTDDQKALIRKIVVLDKTGVDNEVLQGLLRDLYSQFLRAAGKRVPDGADTASLMKSVKTWLQQNGNKVSDEQRETLREIQAIESHRNTPTKAKHPSTRASRSTRAPFETVRKPPRRGPPSGREQLLDDLDYAYSEGSIDFERFYSTAQNILGRDVGDLKPSGVIYSVEETRGVKPFLKDELKKIVKGMRLPAETRSLRNTAEFLTGGRFAMRAAAFQQSRVAELLTSMRRARLTSP